MYIKKTMACGHEQQLLISSRTTEEHLKKCDHMCDECEQKRNVAELSALQLPQLLGTPKQVKWANGIRNKIITWYADRLRQDTLYLYSRLTHEEAREILKYILMNRTNSVYYILLYKYNYLSDDMKKLFQIEKYNVFPFNKKEPKELANGIRYQIQYFEEIDDCYDLEVLRERGETLYDQLSDEIREHINREHYRQKKELGKVHILKEKQEKVLYYIWINNDEALGIGQFDSMTWIKSPQQNVHIALREYFSHGV